MSDDTRERSRHAARDASAPPNGSDGNQTMLQPDGHLDAEMVSAWLDTPDDFSEQDRLAIENHLAGCAQCTQIAAELTAIVRAFQTLPIVETPRPFALTPEMAGLSATPTLPAATRLEEPANLHERKREREARKPVQLYEPTPWYERQMSALRWATAVATLLFVMFVSVDVLGNIDTSGDDDDSGFDTDAASEMMPASAGEAATATPASAAAMMATTEPEERARNSEPESTPAGVPEDESAGGGSEPTATTAAGAAQAATETTADDAVEEEAEESIPPESTDAVATATGEGDDALTMMTPNETEQSGEVEMYGGTDVAQQSRESNTLHLIELALVILIAWLIVAMIALPRLRRPSA